MPQATPVNKKDEEIVVVKTGGCEKQRYTVMLCSTVDGNILPPYVTFKHKTISNIASPGIRPNENGWMDGQLAYCRLDNKSVG